MPCRNGRGTFIKWGFMKISGDLEIDAANIVLLLCQHLPDTYEYAWDELTDDEQKEIKDVRRSVANFYESLKT